tara:strand:+ start:4218 stop:5162 length:945 start_codon:yes stop_codon:yes gene_type:complete
MVNLEQKTLVTIGLILIIILGVWSYYLYHQSNYDNDGNELGCLDTIRNIFGIPSINYLISGKEDGDMSHLNSQELDNLLVTQELDDSLETVGDHMDTYPEEEKEVFNIDNSTFTYNDAELICKAYDSELASYQQVVKAHEKGANWCNYGWSKGQMGLFPIQQEHYDELQNDKDETVRKSCGKPGVNGGKFSDKNLKFGVNCYGIKPKADPSKIKYITPESIEKAKTVKKALEVNKYKKMIEDGTMEIRPFNDNQWSKYSKKKSTYMLTPKHTLEVHDNDSLDNDPRVLNTDINEIEIVDANTKKISISDPTDVL